MTSDQEFLRQWKLNQEKQELYRGFKAVLEKTIFYSIFIHIFLVQIIWKNTNLKVNPNFFCGNFMLCNPKKKNLVAIANRNTSMIEERRLVINYPSYIVLEMEKFTDMTQIIFDVFPLLLWNWHPPMSFLCLFFILLNDGRLIHTFTIVDCRFCLSLQQSTIGGAWIPLFKQF